MGQTLSFTVTTFDGSRYRELAEFQRISPAVKAAKLALEDKRIELAVVRDRDSRLVFAKDRKREWTG